MANPRLLQGIQFFSEKINHIAQLRHLIVFLRSEAAEAKEWLWSVAGDERLIGLFADTRAVPVEVFLTTTRAEEDLVLRSKFLAADAAHSSRGSGLSLGPRLGGHEFSAVRQFSSTHLNVTDLRFYESVNLALQVDSEGGYTWLMFVNNNKCLRQYIVKGEM